MRGTTDELMRRGLRLLAISTALAVGQIGTSLAQYSACPAGYAYSGGTCQPNGYSNPVTGAGSGTAAGAAAGSAAGGPVGAVVGGALGAAGGAVTGTTNAVTGTVGTVTGARPAAPTCAAGYMLYNDGRCYPAPR
jgi:hypothetical protein